VFFKKEIPADKIDKHLKYRMEANIGFAISDMSYMGEYENAIDIIFNFIVEKEHNIDTVATPVLYMMRHSTELGLKYNIRYLEKYSERKVPAGVMRSHNLTNLLVEFNQQFQALHKKYGFDQTILDQYDGYFGKAQNMVTELGEDDSTFRYVQNTKANRVFSHSAKKDVLKIKKYFDETVILLTHTADVIAQHTDYEDLLKLGPEFKNRSRLVYMRFPSYQKNFVAEKLTEDHAQLDTFIWKGYKKSEKVKILEVGNECFLVPF
jgi:hypothetical protein